MKASEVIYSNLNVLFDQKVYPLVRPETEKGTPYLVYTVLNANATNVIMGYTGREMAYLQLDIYSHSYDECENLTNQTIETLGNNVQPFHYENRKYLYENDTKLYRQSVECHIWQTSPATEGLEVWLALDKNPEPYFDGIEKLVNEDLPQTNPKLRE